MIGIVYLSRRHLISHEGVYIDLLDNSESSLFYSIFILLVILLRQVAKFMLFSKLLYFISNVLKRILGINNQ